MSQQPDKLFSEKLRDFQKPAPAGAWDRIEANLEKKNKPGLAWWHIAASIAFFAAIGYIAFVHSTESPNQPIAEAEIKSPDSNDSAPDTPADIPTPQTAEGVDVPELASARTPKPINNTPPKKRDEKQKQESQTEQVTQSSPTQEQESVVKLEPAHSNPVASAEIIHSETGQVTTAQQNILQNERTASLKFTVTANETEKYLNKTALAQATTEDQKPSTFKKLLQKANDLKSNQDPFGDLRDKKNEILALNFKNDKRGQNK